MVNVKHIIGDDVLRRVLPRLIAEQIVHIFHYTELWLSDDTPHGT